MPTYRRRSTRRARSLTVRVSGVALIVLVTFIGSIALLIDPLERGGAPALFALFGGFVALSVALAFAVSRAHMQTLAELIARRAPEAAFPRDGTAVARAVERAVDPAPIDVAAAPPMHAAPSVSAASPDNAAPRSIETPDEDFWGPQPRFDDDRTGPIARIDLLRATAPHEAPAAHEMSASDAPEMPMPAPHEIPAPDAQMCPEERPLEAGDDRAPSESAAATTERSGVQAATDLDEIVARLRRIAERDTP